MTRARAAGETSEAGLAPPDAERERRRQLARERKRRQRSRDKVGSLAVDPMTLSNEAAEAALALGLLTEGDLADRRSLTAAVEDLLNEVLTDGKNMSRRDPKARPPMPR